MRQKRLPQGLRQLAALVLLAVALPSGVALAQPPIKTTGKPQRIVSMNLCTDELLMRLVDPSRIASISYLSRQPVNAPLGLGHIASKLPANHGLAEEILAHEPDLVLTGAYSATAAAAMLRRLGVPVLTFTPETDFDDMRANIRKLGAAVGEPGRAERVISDFNDRLAELQARLPKTDANVATPIFSSIGVNNYIAGRDTLYANIVNAGGYRTLGEALGFSGYRNVSLEQILQVEPALLSTATPWTTPPSLSTLGLSHPALRALKSGTPGITIPERYITCGAPSVLGAVELLVETRLAASNVNKAGRR
jgi:iron complex transport system substrate-binding protein